MNRATAADSETGPSGPATLPSAEPARVALKSLDTLWFQVGGTLCNLTCSHCFISCSPTNRTHETLSLETVQSYLDEAVHLGVKEYYFTGGEPFINREMEEILTATLKVGPATVLTNGLLLDPGRCQRLAEMAERSEYSLDLRVSIDGYTAGANDAIRGEGTFERILTGAVNAVEAGLNPVITVTEVHADNATDPGRRRFLELLAERGIERPRLKILPVFRLGAEAERSGGYEDWQRLSAADSLEEGWEHLQCSSCRMVTDQGVWVCPILVNEPAGRMGARLADSLGAYPLEHQACWTCHVYEVSCRT